MYKQKGLRVVCNNRLRYCYHIARAIVENRNVILSEDDLEALLKENPQAGSFVQETFRGKFFQTGVHALIDNLGGTNREGEAAHGKEHLFICRLILFFISLHKYLFACF